MKFRLYSLLALLMAAGAAVTVSAQDYDDDIYYNPSKAKPQTKSQPSTATRAGNSTYYGGTPSGYTTDYPSADSYTVMPGSGVNIDVDTYNRRGIFATDSAKVDPQTAENFEYTRQIERFYNPDVVAQSPDQDLADIYYSAPAQININVVAPDYWGYPYSPAYYSSAWYWGTPRSWWYYNNPWYYDSWAWGWGPSWSWGWGPSWSWNWGWGPSWGCGWGWGHHHHYYPSWSHSRPGSWGNSRPGYTRPSYSSGNSRPGYRPGSSGSGNYRPGSSGYRPSGNGSYRPGSNSGYRPGSSGSGYRRGSSTNRSSGSSGYRPGSNSNRSEGNSYNRPSNNNNSRPSYRSGNSSYGGSRSGGSYGGGSRGGSRGGGGGSRGGGRH